MRDNYYVDGNTVRKYKEAPRRQTRPEPVQRQEKKVSDRTRKNQARSLSIGGGQAVFLTLSMIVTLSACVYMLTLQSKITVQNKSIAALESELTTMNNDNEANASRLNSEEDLSEIYRVATEELGMVYAGKEQIVLYEQSNPDYVRQYKDVPEK